MSDGKKHFAAPVTAAALIAQQVGGNAVRDGLFLTVFPVESLPYFMGGAAVLAIIAANFAGRLLVRLGPVRLVPILFGTNAVLFLVEWLLLRVQPQAAAALLYLHSAVLGAIAISSFWSLLNESYDPHSAKPLMARVAAAATFGGFIGGVSAERVAALLPEGAMLPILSLIGAVCIAGALIVSRGATARRARPAADPEEAGLWEQFKQNPLLRDMGLVVALAALLASLADYVMKAEAVAYFGRGPQLVRFFGLFYSGTGIGAVVLQTLLGAVVIKRFGLGGSVATHPAVVGAAALLGFVMPTPWRGVLPRALDVVVRNSTFRAGYELLYTPFAEATKRSFKSIIDVACDCAGKGAGALAIVVLVALFPTHPFVAVNVAMVCAAAGELLVARRLRAGYVGVLEGGLRRESEYLDQPVEYSMADFTIATSMTGMDQAALLRALGEQTTRPAAPPTDPVVSALIELRSGDALRVRAVLRNPPRDPIIVGALVQLLARDDLVRSVVSALAMFGARAAGEMVSALLDPATPDVVRRRLPLALKACPSTIARDGLVAAIGTFGFEIRLRCGRALMALTDSEPALQSSFPDTLGLVERELTGVRGDPHLTREHVFNLLALTLEREPVQIAARAFTTDDVYVRGTALEYLETVLPPNIFSELRPLLASGPPPVRRRPEMDVRAELIKAGATMTVSLDELRRQLDATAADET